MGTVLTRNGQHANYDKAIVVMRCLAIVLIVFHHSTSIFAGWPPSDVASLGLPRWVSVLSGQAKLYGLGMFTVISGFLLAKGRRTSLSWEFVYHKTLRILLPCFVTAAIYRLFFIDYSLGHSAINGTHLWYLPMVFIFYLLLPVVKHPNIYKMAGYVLLSYVFIKLLNVVIPFRTFNECGVYIGYFMAGAAMARIPELVTMKKEYIVLIASWVALFGLSGPLLPLGATIEIGCLYYFLKCLLRSNFYQHYFCRSLSSNFRKAVHIISDNSFSIYLIHQFVINLLLMCIPRDLPYFRLTLSSLCFVLSIGISLLVSVAWESGRALMVESWRKFHAYET